MMGKCWMIDLEDEMDGESLGHELETIPEVYHAKVSAFPSNPLEPIVEVWEKWKDAPVFKNPLKMTVLESQLWQAIEKCRAIAEHDPFPEKKS